MASKSKLDYLKKYLPSSHKKSSEAKLLSKLANKGGIDLRKVGKEKVT